VKKHIYLSEPALICCAGQNANELYESCLSGNQGGFVMREYDEGKMFPVGQISAELTEVDFSFLEKFYTKDTQIFTGNTRIIRIINTALEQLESIVEKAKAKYGQEKIGVCFGSCDNGSEASFIAHKALFKNNAFPNEYTLHFQSASFPAEYISHKFGLKGPVFTVATACASGASAIMRGAELIRAGLCSAVIAGGADIVSQTVFTGFNVLEAVSDKPTNPFSKNRKGINLGEGAAFFLLGAEEISDVKLLGAGESADAYHITAPGLDGTGPVKAMQAALLQAGLESSQVGYVNLHGTGTELNDKAEALAMQRVFNANMVHANSTKPITGHTLGAAGALEAAICWMVLTSKRGIPVHCWDGISDEELPFIPASGCGNETPSVCMTNSFAFGGCNVSLILGKQHD